MMAVDPLKLRTSVSFNDNSAQVLSMHLATVNADALHNGFVVFEKKSSDVKNASVLPSYTGLITRSGNSDTVYSYLLSVGQVHQAGMQTGQTMQGVYSFSVYLSDGSKKTAKWTLGEFDFGVVKRSDSQYSTMLASEHVQFQPQDEIHHTFREDPKQPNVVLSMIFTVIVLSPWVFLTSAWSKLGANVSRFPQSGTSEYMNAVVFFGSLVAFMGCLFMYWVSWNFFKLLAVLTVVSVVLTVYGRRMLSDIMMRRN